MFSFLSLTFELWLVMVDLRFITSDNETQKGVTFLMILVEKPIYGFQKVTPILFHELSWNPPCTNFKEVKPTGMIS
jgi:hypothetical protein